MRKNTCTQKCNETLREEANKMKKKRHKENHMQKKVILEVLTQAGAAKVMGGGFCKDVKRLIKEVKDIDFG